MNTEQNREYFRKYYHIQPRILGGSNDSENLRLVHALCNSLRPRKHLERELQNA